MRAGSTAVEAFNDPARYEKNLRVRHVIEKLMDCRPLAFSMRGLMQVNHLAPLQLTFRRKATPDLVIR